jgi:hypothetical protein
MFLSGGSLCSVCVLSVRLKLALLFRFKPLYYLYFYKDLQLKLPVRLFDVTYLPSQEYSGFLPLCRGHTTDAVQRRRNCRESVSSVAVYRISAISATKQRRQPPLTGS